MLMSLPTRGWCGVPANFIIQTVFDPVQYGDSSTTPATPWIFTALTYTITWGDGTSDTLNLHSDGGSGSVTHSYPARDQGWTITIDGPLDMIESFDLNHAGVTVLPSDLATTLSAAKHIAFEWNFLAALPDMSGHPKLRDWSHRYNNVVGDTPAWAIPELRRLTCSHNAHTALSDLTRYPKLIWCDAGYNPIATYRGTTLPVYLSWFDVSHCKLKPPAGLTLAGIHAPGVLDAFASQLRTNWDNGAREIVEFNNRTGSTVPQGRSFNIVAAAALEQAIAAKDVWYPSGTPATSPAAPGDWFIIDSATGNTERYTDPDWFGPSAVPVEWIDLSLPRPIAVLPIDGTDWPDPAFWGPYTVGDHTRDNPATAPPPVTVIAKYGSRIYVKFWFEADVGTNLPMYKLGAVCARTPEGGTDYPASTYFSYQVTSGKVPVWSSHSTPYDSAPDGQAYTGGPAPGDGTSCPALADFLVPPNGSEFWTSFNGSWFTDTDTLTQRAFYYQGGENETLLGSGKTDADFLYTQTPFSYWGPQWYPTYNEREQDQGRPRPVDFYGHISSWTQGVYDGDEYEQGGWTGKHYLAGVLDGDRVAMTDFHVSHLMSGVADHRKALFVIWYQSTAPLQGEWLRPPTINGVAMHRVGNGLVEIWGNSYAMDAFVSDELDEQNLQEIAWHVQDYDFGSGSLSELYWHVAFVRDASDVVVHTTDRPTRVPEFPGTETIDGVLGSSNWQHYAGHDDLVVIAAGARHDPNTNWNTLLPASDGLIFGTIGGFVQSHRIDHGGWFQDDQNSVSSVSEWNSQTQITGATLLARVGVLRNGGPDQDVGPAYWTLADVTDWTQVGGAARMFVFRPKRAFPLPPASSYALGQTGDKIYPFRWETHVPDGVGHSMGMEAPFWHRWSHPGLAADLGSFDITGLGGVVTATQQIVLVHVSIGRDHCLAIGNDGQVYTAGSNATGQLGLGDTLDRAEWTKVPGLYESPDTSYRAIWAWAADGYSLVITDDAKGWIWGNDGGTGVLGVDPSDPTYQAFVTSPVKLDKLAAQIVGCTGELLLIDSAGAIWHRGSNHFGQRGNAVQDDLPHADWLQVTVSVPVQAVRVSFIGTVLVLSQDGTQLWAWGTNTSDYLTNTGTAPTPLLVPTHLSMWDATLVAPITRIGLLSIEHSTTGDDNAGAVVAVINNRFGVTGDNGAGQTGNINWEGSPAPYNGENNGVEHPVPEDVDWMEVLSPYAAAAYIRTNGVDALGNPELHLWASGYNEWGDVNPVRQSRVPGWNHCYFTFGPDDALDVVGDTYMRVFKGMFPEGAALGVVQSVDLGTIVFLQGGIPPVNKAAFVFGEIIG